MHKTFTFNNEKKEWIYTLEGLERPPFAPINRTLVNVENMNGAYLSSTHLQPLVINVPVGFKSNSDMSGLELKEEMSAWLFTENPAPLVFDDEPERTYYAVVQNTMEDFQEFVKFKRGTIQFLCLDPYKYGPEQPYEFTADTAIIENKGTAEADPVFTLNVLQPTTFAMISNGDDYMMIGQPIDVDDIVYNRLETVLNDTCSTLTGWTALVSGAELDTGIVGGEMEVQGGYAFSAKTYGTNPNGWVGPAIKKSLSESLQDFRVEIQIGAFNTSGAVGSLELHLLDESENTIAVLAMRDSSASLKENRAVIQLGKSGNRHKLVDFNGGYLATWNDFSGIIRLEREGNEFRAYVAVVDNNGEHVRRYNLPNPFIDTLSHYQAKLAQIIVYDAKSKEYDPYRKLMNNIYVGKINQEVGIPYIADVGDIITLDHAEDNILINGESIFGEGDVNIQKDFGATFFKLKPGENSLATLPEGAFRTTGKCRERYR